MFVRRRLLAQAGRDRVDNAAMIRRPGTRTALITDIVDTARLAADLIARVLPW